MNRKIATILAAGFGHCVDRLRQEGPGAAAPAALPKPPSRPPSPTPAGPARPARRSDRSSILPPPSVRPRRSIFDTDRYNVDSQDAAALQAQAQYFARYPQVTFTIEGHADERGTREYNLALGETPRQFGQEFPGQPRRRCEPDFRGELRQGTPGGAGFE